MADPTKRFLRGESLIWYLWWIMPLLFHKGFFHKWEFYGYAVRDAAAQAGKAA